MKLINHRLYHDDDEPYPYRETPNRSGVYTPRFLVMHYTAGSSAEQSINWLTQTRAKASAHVVIGRDGGITQLAPFNIVTWHAGVSNWKSYKGLNKYSIGIELDNPGPLNRAGDGWVSWFGGRYDASDVIEAVHKNRSTLQGWLLYTQEQMEATLELSELLVEAYGLEDVIGHDDIAPTRKTDPGPAFPMHSFRARLFGRPEASSDEDEQIFETAANLNIRTGPGSQYQVLPGSPLPRGTRLDILDESGSWLQVDVLDEVNGTIDLEGWVHGRYVRPVQ